MLARNTEFEGFLVRIQFGQGMVGSTRAAADLQLLRPPGGPKLGRNWANSDMEGLQWTQDDASYGPFFASEMCETVHMVV